MDSNGAVPNVIVLALRAIGTDDWSTTIGGADAGVVLRRVS